MEKDKGTTREGNTLVKAAVWSLPLAVGHLFKFCLFYTKNKKKDFNFTCTHSTTEHTSLPL